MTVLFRTPRVVPAGLLAVLAVWLLLPGTVGAQTYASAIEYNDAIVSQQTRVGLGIIKLGQMFQGATPAELQAELRGLQATSASALAKVQALPGYGGSTAMRDAAIPLFTFYRDIMRNEYARMVEILCLDPDQITDAHLAEIEALAAAIGERETPLDDAFQAAQRAFATRHGFAIDHNPLQDQIDRLGNEDE